MLYPFIGAATNRAKSSQCSTTPFLRRVNLILSCTVATGVLGTVGLDAQCEIGNLEIYTEIESQEIQPYPIPQKTNIAIVLRDVWSWRYKKK